MDPKTRPTTQQILKLPILLARCNMLKDIEVVDIDSHTPGEDMMLGTIRVPKNLRFLSERLPKSNYGGNVKKNAMLSSKAESSKESTKQDVLSSSELLAMALPHKSQTKNVSDDLQAIIEEDHLNTPSLQMLDPPTPESIGNTPKQLLISKSERRPSRAPVANGAIIN